MCATQQEKCALFTGLQNLGDVQKLIELMPRPLAQYLRVSAIVRNTAANLGCTIHDRLRVNATAALRGVCSFTEHRSGVLHAPSCSTLCRTPMWCADVSASVVLMRICDVDMLLCRHVSTAFERADSVHRRFAVSQQAAQPVGQDRPHALVGLVGRLVAADDQPLAGGSRVGNRTVRT